jgi:hypothetical protein
MKITRLIAEYMRREFDIMFIILSLGLCGCITFFPAIQLTNRPRDENEALRGKMPKLFNPDSHF